MFLRKNKAIKSLGFIYKVIRKKCFSNLFMAIFFRVFFSGFFVMIRFTGFLGEKTYLPIFG